MQKNKTYQQVDIWLILIYLILIISGWLILYSVNSQTQADSILQLNYIKQLIWIFLSITLGAAVIYLLKPYTIYSSIQIFYILMLLIAVIVGLTVAEVKGARSWIRLGGFSIQPAEFLKLATALIFAKIIAINKKKLNEFKTLILAFVPVFLAMLAVMLQGDMGTALVFGAFIIPAYREGLLKGYVIIYILLYGLFFFLSLMFADLTFVFLAILALAILLQIINYNSFFKQIISVYLGVFTFLYLLNAILGNSWSNLTTIFISYLLASTIFIGLYFQKIKDLKNYFILLGLTLLLFGITYFSPKLYNKLEPHQKARIEYYIHPEKLTTHFSTQDVSYNIRQAILSISAGGIKGRGYLKGTHNKLKFVPEQDKDYIFCTIAEELGFFGSIITFILFFILFVRIFIIAERHKSVFVRVYAYSVLSIIFFHFAINLGSTLTLLPVIGIPLPFFSYGGSAMLNFSLMLAVLLNFDKYRNLSFEDIYH